MFNRGPVTAVVTIGLAIAIIVLLGIGRLAPPEGFDAADRDVTSPGVESRHGQPIGKPRLFARSAGSTQSAKQVATIRFFDGNTAEVRFRPMPGNTVAYPERLSSKLEEWKEAALRGDADVARMLYKSLNNCRSNIYESDEEFAAAIDRFQQTHVIEMSVAGRDPVPMDVEPTAVMLAELRKSYKFCKGIKEDDIQAADNFLEMAADNGNVLAQLTLGKKLLTKPEGRIYLEMAWQSGSIDAAGSLAKSLTVRNNEVSKDLIAAYAYQALYAELVRADFESRGLAEAPFSKTWMEADASGLARIEKQLRPPELRLAQELTKKLYAGNENCCISR